MQTSFKSPLKYGIAIILILWGVLLMIGGLVNMFPENAAPRITVADIFMFVTLGIAPCVLGAILWFRTLQERKELAMIELEQDILRLAKSMHNKLTATDVAVKIVLPIKQAEEMLQEMVIKGWAQLEISDSGIPVYNFPTLISGTEKREATQV